MIISDCQMEDAGDVKFTYGEIVETKAKLIVEINEAWRDSLKGTKPQIIRDKLQMATIKAGQSHTFEADIMGDPITEKIWRKEDGEPIQNNDKYNIVREDYFTSITISNAVRSVS